jgi:hypothetical protein
MWHFDMFVTLKVFKLIGHSNDGRRHGRGTYLLVLDTLCINCARSIPTLIPTKSRKAMTYSDVTHLYIWQPVWPVLCPASFWRIPPQQPCRNYAADADATTIGTGQCCSSDPAVAGGGTLPPSIQATRWEGKKKTRVRGWLHACNFIFDLHANCRCNLVYLRFRVRQESSSIFCTCNK